VPVLAHPKKRPRPIKAMTSIKPFAKPEFHSEISKPRGELVDHLRLFAINNRSHIFLLLHLLKSAASANTDTDTVNRVLKSMRSNLETLSILSETLATLLAEQNQY
jgi:hypothetical protein